MKKLRSAISITTEDTVMITVNIIVFVFAFIIALTVTQCNDNC